MENRDKQADCLLQLCAQRLRSYNLKITKKTVKMGKKRQTGVCQMQLTLMMTKNTSPPRVKRRRFFLANEYNPKFFSHL